MWRLIQLFIIVSTPLISRADDGACCFVLISLFSLDVREVNSEDGCTIINSTLEFSQKKKITLTPKYESCVQHREKSRTSLKSRRLASFGEYIL